MKKVSLLTSLVLVVFDLTIFFGDFLNSYTIIQFICLLILGAQLIMFHRKIIIPKFILPFFLYMLIVIFNIFVGGEIKFVITFTISCFLMLVLINMPQAMIIQYNIMKFCTFIHLCASLFVYFVPVALVNFLFKKILGGNYFVNYDWRVRQGLNVGITLQPGTNAMFLLIFFAICFSGILMNQRKGLSCVGAVLSFFMIITTTKRSAILFGVMTVIIVLLFFANTHIKKKQFIRIFFAGFVSLIILFAVYKYTGLFDLIIDKMKSLMSEGDVSNGRYALWIYAISKFESSPILGVGLKEIYMQKGFDVHNTYIQILAETGLVGFACFSLALFAICYHLGKNAKREMAFSDNILVKKVVLFGFYLLIFLIIYGVVGNTFIDYIPISLFTISIAMANISQERVVRDDGQYNSANI